MRICLDVFACFPYDRTCERTTGDVREVIVVVRTATMAPRCPATYSPRLVRSAVGIYAISAPLQKDAARDRHGSLFLLSDRIMPLPWMDNTTKPLARHRPQSDSAPSAIHCPQRSLVAPFSNFSGRLV